MQNRDQNTVIDLIKAYDKDATPSAYDALLNYLLANFATNKALIEEYLPVEKFLSEADASLSAETVELLEVMLILHDPTDSESGKKVVGQLRKLMLKYPRNSVLIHNFTQCFTRGATYVDLPDYIEYEKIQSWKMNGLKRDQLKVYCHAKALELDSKCEDHWTYLGVLFQRGAIFADLPASTRRNTLLFPSEAQHWKPAQLIAYCLGKSLLINARNVTAWNNLGSHCKTSALSFADLPSCIDWVQLMPEANKEWRGHIELRAYCYTKALLTDSKSGIAWHNLGNAFCEGATIAELPTRFVLMIYSCIKNDAPANIYCADFCYKKGIELTQDVQLKKKFNDDYIKWQFEREITIERKNTPQQKPIITNIPNSNNSTQNVTKGFSFMTKPALPVFPSPLQQPVQQKPLQDKLPNHGQHSQHQMQMQQIEDMQKKQLQQQMQQQQMQMQKQQQTQPQVQMLHHTISQLIDSFINSYGMYHTYNDLLRELERARNFGEKIYANFRREREAYLSAKPESPELNRFLVKVAFELKQPGGKISEDIVKSLCIYAVKHPTQALLNFCLGMSCFQGTSHTYLSTNLIKDLPSKIRIFLTTHFLAKDLTLYSGNDEAWRMLGTVLSSPDFSSLVKFKKDAHHINRLIPDYCEWKKNEMAAYCFAKMLAINPNLDSTQFEYRLNSIEDKNIKNIILNIKLNLPITHSNQNSPPKADNSESVKRKADDDDDLPIIVSNKKPKTTNTNNSAAFFAKKDPQGPVLSFNIDIVRLVIKILRGNNNAMDNCTHLAKDLLEYFKTGCIPVSPSSTVPSKLEDFDVEVETNWIKREKGDPYLGVTKAVICLEETNFPDLPYDMHIPQTPGGTMEVDKEPILDLTQYRQPSASYHQINNCLHEQARKNEQGVSFGLINIGRCGRYIDAPGHMLVYFATTTDVWYMDCELYNGEEQQDYGCIYSDLNQAHKFAGKDRLGPDTFGGNVFYTPSGPRMPVQEMAVEVKQEFSL